MASVSGKYTSGATGLGANNAQPQPGLWSYAVPPDEPDLESSMNDHNSNENSSIQPSRQPLSNQVNGTSRTKTRPNNKFMQNLDAEYVNSGGLRPPAQIHEQGDASGTNSEADSLLDLYKINKDQSKVNSRGRQTVKRKESLGAVSALDESNQEAESKWIHRDKLAQIESRELLAMGGISGQRLSARSRSRMGKKSSKAPSVDVEAEAHDGQPSVQDTKRQRTVSPTLSNEDLEYQEMNQSFSQDQAMSSEQMTARSQNTQHGRRPSSSKIPITKSPGAADSSSPTQPGSPTERLMRARSASQTSRDLLYATGSTAPTSSPGTVRGTQSPNSPAKSKLSNKTTPPSGTRTAARGTRSTSGQSRPRTATGPASRPGTSSGPRSPEGEPPWIATMYKPDPRLPPDQQMLPTHAKRLAQEQGLTSPEMYDPPQRDNSDFMLLDSEEQENDSPNELEDSNHDLQQRNVPSQNRSPTKIRGNHGFSGPGGYQTEQQSSFRGAEGRASPYSTDNHESNEWPLRSPSDKQSFQPALSPKSDTGSFGQSNARSGTPVVESGYSLMPTIHNPKELEQRPSLRSGLSDPAPMAGSNMATQPIRVPEAPEPDEKEAKKKGGCAACCIVM